MCPTQTKQEVHRKGFSSTVSVFARCLRPETEGNMVFGWVGWLDSQRSFVCCLCIHKPPGLKVMIEEVFFLFCSHVMVLLPADGSKVGIKTLLLLLLFPVKGPED